MSATKKENSCILCLCYFRSSGIWETGWERIKIVNLCFLPSQMNFFWDNHPGVFNVKCSILETAELMPKKKVVAIDWQPYSPALLQPNLNNSRQIKYISHSVLAIVRNCTIQFICANKESHHTIYRNVMVCFFQDIKLPFPWIPALCSVAG